jgi:hypothetical protein
VIAFEWDDSKAAKNLQKHGVSFDEAKTAFDDERGILIADPEHSDDEARFVLLGASSTRLLVVCHCYRKEETIRIISARRANKREASTYRERNDS